MLSLVQAKQTLNGADKWRGDCFDCGGKNTLSISNIMGEVKWFCFKAHCKTSGKGDVRRTTDEIVKTLLYSGIMRGKDRELIRVPFDVPTYFTHMSSTLRCKRFFKFLYDIGERLRKTTQKARAKITSDIHTNQTTQGVAYFC